MPVAGVDAATMPEGRFEPSDALVPETPEEAAVDDEEEAWNGSERGERSRRGSSDG